MISKIAKYPIEAELGRGGFGRVYRAWDPDVRRPVAIKVLLADGEPDLLRRFQLEVGTTGSLQHKNIVTIHASGEEGGTPYLVMELLEGETLSSIIKHNKPLSILEKVRIMSQVAEGLAYAHSKGVVHRDIKPGNIMLLPDGTVKIMDFGIALGPNRMTLSVTLDGFIVGTVPYMAPEQFLSGSKASEQTDIFGFGDVYYELLTGKHPFLQFGNDLNSIQNAIRTYEPPSIMSLAPDCPEGLELVVHRCLAKDRDFRYQRFEELLLDSEAILIDLQQERAAAILAEVDNLVNLGNLPAALEQVNRAMELDPGNRKVRQVRDRIAEGIRKDKVRQRVEVLVAEGDAHIEQRRFAEAIQSYEAAARHDPADAAVQKSLANAKARLESYSRAGQLVSEARLHQQKGRLPDAIDRLKQAVATDPHHTDAAVLLSRLQEQWERHLGEQRLQEAMRLASAHLEAHRFDDALAALADVRKERPGAPGLRELVERIERDRDQETRRAAAERFNRALALIRETIEAGNLDRAGSMIDRLRFERDLDAAAAETLQELQAQLNAQIRVQEIARCRQQAGELLREKRYPEVKEILTQALLRFPDESSLARLKRSAEEQEHEEAVAAALAHARELRASGDAAGASNAVAQARQKLGEEAALILLSRQIEQEIEQQRYASALETLLRTGRQLLDAGQFSRLTELLNGAAEYSHETEVAALREAARLGAAAAEERRVAADALARAAAFRSEGNWDRALAALEEALTRYPRHSELKQTTAQLREQIAVSKRLSEIAKLRESIAANIDRKAFKRAADQLAKAQHDFPGEGAFYELGRKLEDAQFQARLGEVEKGIQAELDAGNLPQALEQLEATRTIYSRDPRWQSLADQVAQRQKERSEGLEKTLADVEQVVQAKRFEEAVRILDAASRRYGAEESLMKARAAAFAARAAEERERGLAEAWSEAERFRSHGRLAEALEIIGAAFEQFGEDARLLELKRQVESERDALRVRAEDLHQAMGRAQECLRRDDPLGATQILQHAAGRYPTESAVVDLLRIAETRLAYQQQQEAVAQIAAGAEKALAGNQPRKALELLEEGLKQFAGAERLVQLRDRAQAAEARAECMRAIERLEAGGELEEALQTIEAFQKTYPVDRELSDSKARIERDLAARRAREAQELERQRRQQEVADLALQAETLLNEGRLEEVISLLETRFPNEPLLLDVVIRARKQIDARQRDAMIQQVHALHDAGRLEEALERIEEANRRYGAAPGSEEFADSLRSAIREQETRRKREQDLTRLIAIEGQIRSGLRKRMLRGLSAEARSIQERNSQDEELADIALRLQQSIEAALAEPASSRRIPWKPVGIGAAAIALIAAAVLLIPKRHETSAIQKSVEIRPQPESRPAPNSDTPKAAAPAPVAPPVQPATLAIETGLPGTLVFVDGVVRGSTDQRGALNLSVDAGAHQVRVERPGFQAPAGKRVVAVNGASRGVAFQLTPQTAKVQATPPVAGLGAPASAGNAAPREVTTTPAPRLEPAEQDWESIRNAADPVQIQAYLNRYPSGPHADEAHARLDEVSWSKVGRNNPSELQAYVKAFPNGAHAGDAQSQLDDLDWKGVAQNDGASLRAYLDRHPNGRHKADAQRGLDQLEKQAREAEQRLAQQRAQQALLDQQLREKAQAIRDTLGRLNTAFQRKQVREIRAVWPRVPSLYTDSIHDGGSVTFRSIGQPEIAADSASVNCDLVTSINSSPVKVTLSRTGDHWSVEKVTAR